MKRSLARAFFYPLTACLVFILAATTVAQITEVNNTTSTPTEGVGHDYLKGLSETVNPANGSVSLRFRAPVAKGRGLTIPFSFGYDSNGYRHLKAGYYPNYGSAYWESNTGYFGQGGWTYSAPQLNWDSWTGEQAVVTGYNNNGPIYTLYYCYYATAYTFRDGSAGVHALGLGTRWFDSSGASQYCTGSSAISGGDPQVRAALTAPPQPGAPGFYYQGPVVVYEPDGTVYNFSLTASVPGSDATHYVLPTSIEDRNGNIITVSGSTFTDTLGRTLFSGALGSAGQTKTVSISGINYQVTWKSVTASYSVTSTWAGQSNVAWTCSPIPAVSDTQTVVSKITLPNGQAYTFYYGNDVTPHNATHNSYGLLSEIDYPSGGWVQYTWKPSDTMNELADYAGQLSNTCNAAGGYCPAPAQDGCLYQYKTPVVASRSVSFGGSTPVLTQTFTYSTTWNPPVNGNALGVTWNSKSTNVTTTDDTLGKSYLTQYTYGFVNAPPVPLIYNTLANQIPVESSVNYYDWSNTTSPLRTVTKSWYDQYDLASEAVTEAGKTSTTTYCYVGSNCVPALNNFAQLQEKDEYDFGIAPPNAPTRKTVTTYQGFSGTPGLIAEAPCKIVVNDGNGNQYAETDYYYDGGTTLCGASVAPSVTGVSGLVAGTHDETQFGPSSSTPRGNLTKTVTWANTGGSPSITYAYDETGRVVSMTDPCGNGTCSDMTGSSHTATYAYTDSYTTLSGGQNVTYTPSGNTNAYLTKITDALGHVSSFSYDYNNGQLTKATDPNSNVTSYIYNDSLARPTQANYADGGQKNIVYNDSAPSPTITSCLLISGTAGAACSSTSPPSGYKTSVMFMDGMEHAVQSELLSDPDGPTYTATTYDGLGRSRLSYNPTRCSPPTTNCGTETTWGYATFNYDSLGRQVSVIRQDGSTATTSYSGACTTTTDETGKSRMSCTDGLGRLTGVWEDPSGLNYETDYGYDALGNLLNVTQKGGSSSSSNWRTRTFTYDSLSRLLCAANPEVQAVTCPTTAAGTLPSGAVIYSYDLNGNVSNKKMPEAGQTGTIQTTQTYSYDLLNRLTQKTYTNPSSSLVKYGYDGTSISGCGVNPPSITSPTNRIGRRSAMCAGFSASSWSFDQMGRVISEVRTNKGSASTTLTTNYGYNLDGSLHFLYYPSGDYVNFITGGAGRNTEADLKVNSSLTEIMLASYTPDGSLASGVEGPLAITNAYNSRLQPILLSDVTGTNVPVFSLCYDFHLHQAINNPPCQFSAYTSGDNGNVSQIVNNVSTDGTRQSVFQYDALNRLSQANSLASSGTNCWGETYTVDGWGNLTNRAGVSGMGTCYTEAMNYAPATVQNHLTGLSYDAAGNLLNDALSHPVSYDAENRISTDAGYTYSYDADGFRMEKASGSTGTMYWPGLSGNTLTESDLTGAINEEYIYFNGQRVARVDRPSGTAHYYFSDHLGSASVITDSNGNATERYFYYPYGGMLYSTGSDPNRYKFTGKERDSESNLDMFDARYYGSSLGRFMTPDWSDVPTAVPYANFEDPQTLNQYGYVRNNPLFRADADGHGFWDTLKNCFVYTRCVSDEKISETAKADREWLKQNCISCFGKSGSDFDKMSDWQVIQYRDSVEEARADGRVAYGTPPNVGIGTAGLPPGLMRMQLLKQVQDPGLRNIINDLYKDTSSFGEGGTAEAIEYERATGRPIGGRFHSQKGIQYSRALEKAINSGRLSAEDKAVAQRLLNDLTTALTKTK